MAKVSSLEEQEIFPYTTASRPALGATQPHIQWVLGFHRWGVKGKEREADHSIPPSAEVKNGGAVPPLSHTPTWCNA
jgi:hypothetical protein